MDFISFRYKNPTSIRKPPAEDWPPTFSIPNCWRYLNVLKCGNFTLYLIQVLVNGKPVRRREWQRDRVKEITICGHVWHACVCLCIHIWNRSKFWSKETIVWNYSSNQLHTHSSSIHIFFSFITHLYIFIVYRPSNNSFHIIFFFVLFSRLCFPFCCCAYFFLSLLFNLVHIFFSRYLSINTHQIVSLRFFYAIRLFISCVRELCTIFIKHFYHFNLILYLLLDRAIVVSFIFVLPLKKRHDEFIVLVEKKHCGQ